MVWQMVMGQFPARGCDQTNPMFRAEGRECLLPGQAQALACRTYLRFISATQSLSGELGGLPIIAEPGPVMVVFLPVLSAPPVRGLYHWTVNVALLSLRSMVVLLPPGWYTA